MSPLLPAFGLRRRKVDAVKCLPVRSLELQALSANGEWPGHSHSVRWENDFVL